MSTIAPIFSNSWSVLLLIAVLAPMLLGPVTFDDSTPCVFEVELPIPLSYMDEIDVMSGFASLMRRGRSVGAQAQSTARSISTAAQIHKG
jgi:hypothetical protein